MDLHWIGHSSLDVNWSYCHEEIFSKHGGPSLEGVGFQMIEIRRRLNITIEGCICGISQHKQRNTIAGLLQTKPLGDTVNLKLPA